MWHDPEWVPSDAHMPNRKLGFPPFFQVFSDMLCSTPRPRFNFFFVFCHFFFFTIQHPVALSVMCNDTFCTITIVVVQNVPVAHAHNILPWLPVLDRAASGYFWWHHFRLEMCTRSLPVAPPPRSTLSNTTLSVPIYYLKGIGFVKRLYESGVIGLIGINLFIFIQKDT
jgi:hypothetical protein